MTQVKYVSNQKQRLARLLGNLEGQGARKWEPSREDMIFMRQCSRAGLSMGECYLKLKPDCTIETFRRRSKSLSIIWG